MCLSTHFKRTAHRRFVRYKLKTEFSMPVFVQRIYQIIELESCRERTMMMMMAADADIITRSRRRKRSERDGEEYKQIGTQLPTQVDSEALNSNSSALLEFQVDFKVSSPAAAQHAKSLTTKGTHIHTLFSCSPSVCG